MKLSSITVENILGIRAASVALTTPVTMFAGHNRNGKTSLAEAVRMALGGDIQARGVALKKDLQALVHEGAKSGSAEVQLADGLVTFALVPSGKTTQQAAYVPHPALPFVLEPHAFAALKADERRSMLFSLMGLKITPAVVIERLAARGVDKIKAERVGPLLKAGFDAACTEAKRKATEAKGAWRAVTGETYGAVKAEDWKAEAPKHDEAAAKKLAVDIQHADVALEGWQQTIGKLQAEEQRRAGLRAKLPALTEQASKLQRIQDKLTADESGLAEWAQRLADVTARAGAGPRMGLVHDLAAGVNYLLSFIDADPPSVEEEDARAALQAYEQQFGAIGIAGDPAAQAQLPKTQQSRDLMASAVANGRRDLDAAKLAQAEVASITAELEEVFDAAGLAEAREQADKLKATRAETVKKLDVIKAQKAAADAADKKTASAAEHHADVAAWDKIADALAPDGIPGEMLAEALGPFNERLTQSANDAEWLHIVINDDIEITTAGGRPYKLLSESEKWRADAMLAEAISHLSGLKLLLLDGFDVLDLQGRADLLAWLEILAAEGELETALLFGTLKAIPASLPASIAAHWIEGGQLVQLKAAA